MEAGNPRLDEMFFEAEQHIRQGEVVQAVSVLEELINEQPDYGRAHSHLGWLYENEYKDFNRSEQHYKAALSFSPDYPLLYLNYASLLSRLERYEELSGLLERAMKVEGIKKSEVYYEYGIMYELQGHFDEAMVAYKNAIFNSVLTQDIQIYHSAIERCEDKKVLLGDMSLNGEAKNEEA